jgi:hypothetical protein
MQDNRNKEALFNEVKGSLFEYLVAKNLAVKSHAELTFQNSLDQNYLSLLSQQDRMIRQFYPEMLPFLNAASKETSESIVSYLKLVPTSPRVVGKFSNSRLSEELQEADLVLMVENKSLPVSLKLNKKNAFVNTKSAGIKSFFTQYFPFINPQIQLSFNQLVDMEFDRMAWNLHAYHDMNYSGSFELWAQRGFSELPGELSSDEREILKAYYARIASEIHKIFESSFKMNPDAFKKSLLPLMGFGKEEILQVICFHDFPVSHFHQIDIHCFNDVTKGLDLTLMKPFSNISSVEFQMGEWLLQIRVKPMNKFTNTAIKINCSVKVKRPYIS